MTLAAEGPGLVRRSRGSGPGEKTWVLQVELDGTFGASAATICCTGTGTVATARELGEFARPALGRPRRTPVIGLGSWVRIGSWSDSCPWPSTQSGRGVWPVDRSTSVSTSHGRPGSPRDEHVGRRVGGPTAVRFGLAGVGCRSFDDRDDRRHEKTVRRRVPWGELSSRRGRVVGPSSISYRQGKKVAVKRRLRKSRGWKNLAPRGYALPQHGPREDGAGQGACRRTR